MRRFVHRENIKHFKQLLDRTTDEAQRDRIMKLLAEEEAKAREGDAAEKKLKAS